MLKDHRLHPTIPATDLERARTWYADKLGLTPAQAVPGGLVYPTGGDGFFLLFASSVSGAVDHQLAAWRVDDLAAEVAQLRARGVVFEDYDRPGLRTVDGIAPTPVGRGAWFKDSEGNVLTLIELD